MTTLKVGSIEHPTSGSLATINGTAPSNRNLIINGAMQVAQRGTTGTANDYTSLDRFKQVTAGGTSTLSQESLTSGDPFDEGFRYFMRTTNTSVGSDQVTHDRSFSYRPEAQDMASCGWNYTDPNSFVTLSFWVRSSLAGTYYVYMRTMDGTQMGYSFGFTLSANTWTKVTHSIPGNSSISFDNDNGPGMRFYWAIDLGTDSTDSGHTTETWAAYSGSSRTPDFAQDWITTANATFDVTGVQLEVGSVATPFEHRSYGDELARCQRYYISLVKGIDQVFPGVYFYWATTELDIPMGLPVAMRATPSIAQVTGSSYYRASPQNDNFDGFSGVQYASPGGAPTSINLFAASAQNVSGSTGAVGYVHTVNSNASVAFSAEL